MVLQLPEARTFVAAESSFQAAALAGPAEAFMVSAGELRRAATALRQRLHDADAPDVDRLAEELDAVLVLVGPGLAKKPANQTEVRSSIAAAVRQQLFSLRAYRHALVPLEHAEGSGSVSQVNRTR